MLAVCFALVFFGETVSGKHRAAVLMLTGAFFVRALRMTVELRPMPAEAEPLSLQPVPADEESLSLRINAMERKKGQLVLTCGDTLLYMPEGLCGGADGRREPEIGNRIEVFGKISAFPPATNPGQFDAESFYRAKGLRRRMYVSRATPPEVEFAPGRGMPSTTVFGVSGPYPYILTKPLSPSHASAADATRTIGLRPRAFICLSSDCASSASRDSSQYSDCTTDATVMKPLPPDTPRANEKRRGRTAGIGVSTRRFGVQFLTSRRCRSRRRSAKRASER